MERALECLQLLDKWLNVYCGRGCLDGNVQWTVLKQTSFTVCLMFQIWCTVLYLHVFEISLFVSMKVCIIFIFHAPCRAHRSLHTLVHISLKWISFSCVDRAQSFNPLNVNKEIKSQHFPPLLPTGSNFTHQHPSCPSVTHAQCWNICGCVCMQKRTWLRHWGGIGNVEARRAWGAGNQYCAIFVSRTFTETKWHIK